MENVNWLAVIVASLVPSIIGAMWYSPPLFLNPLLNTLKLKEENMKKGNLGLIYGAGFITSFLIAIFLNFFINYVPRPTALDGAAIGLFTALTFAVPLIVSNSLFQRLGIRNALVNSGYWLLTIVIMSAILGGWQ